MLANHYYQSSQAWVVFFVPGSDADIVFYNEFMHYLEEKQRAAVSKLDDTTTLFLVPPSDFSEKVLKVPGKLSISGLFYGQNTKVLDMGMFNSKVREDMVKHHIQRIVLVELFLIQEVQLHFCVVLHEMFNSYLWIHTLRAGTIRTLEEFGHLVMCQLPTLEAHRCNHL